MDLCELQEVFVKERRYLKNVSPNTLEWYKYWFRAFEPHLKNCQIEGLRPALKAAVMALRESKLQPSSLNDYIRALNAFLHWAKDEGYLPELIRLDYLKEEQRLIATLNAQQIKRIVDWKPVGFCGKRLHALCCILLDTGLRFEEALTLRREDVDFDNLLLRIRGKGGKHRVVPISYELRKVDKKAAVLADMRRIYDGKLHKEFGTAENPEQHEWTGRITFLVAVTGEIDRQYSVFNVLGERFVMIRWPRAGGIQAALVAMNQQPQEMTEEVRAAVHSLSHGQQNLAEAIRVLAEALARTGELEAERQKELLEHLSLISTEVALPSEKRKLGPLRSSVNALRECIATAAQLAALWTPIEQLLKGMGVILV